MGLDGAFVWRSPTQGRQWLNNLTTRPQKQNPPQIGCDGFSDLAGNRFIFLAGDSENRRLQACPMGHKGRMYYG